MYKPEHEDTTSSAENESYSEEDSCSEDESYSADDIRNIAFEKIDDDYSYGKYGNFNVILMMKNGYINVTKLCADAKTKKGKSKQFRFWRLSDGATSLIEEVSADVKIPTSELLIMIKSSSKNNTVIRGTYAHPDLVPHIASWASTQFAIKVSKIVNAYNIQQALMKKDKVIKGLNEKLDVMNNDMKKLLAKNDDLLAKNDDLLIKNNKMDKRLKRLLVKNDEIMEQNDSIKNKVDIIASNRVMPTGQKEDVEFLIIVKLNDDPEEYESDAELYDYSVIRAMDKSVPSRLKQTKSRHPDMKVILKISYIPNSMNLWHNIKIELGKKMIIRNTKFDLKRNYDEERFIKDVKTIYRKRLDVLDA